MPRAIPLPDLQRFLARAFQALGASESEAAVVADVLAQADEFGIGTHGVQRLGYYAERIRGGVTRPGAPIEVVTETDTTAVLDGNHGFGHVVSTRAMDLAIDKASRHGLGAVAVRNSTHFGHAGFYALRATARDMIGIVSTNARPCQAPTGGTEPLFGTNPIAFGAPSAGTRPFLFDAASSVTQRGRIEVAAREGTHVPEGIAIGRDGSPLTDPNVILRELTAGNAALLPLGGTGTESGGHKGFGLAMCLEILCAALAGGPFLDGLGGGDREATWTPYRTGHFFLALDTAAFGGANGFKHTVASIQDRLRTAGQAPGAETPVQAAGDPEWSNAARHHRDGVTLSGALLAELETLSAELGVSPL